MPWQTIAMLRRALAFAALPLAAAIAIPGAQAGMVAGGVTAAAAHSVADLARVPRRTVGAASATTNSATSREAVVALNENATPGFSRAF